MAQPDLIRGEASSGLKSSKPVNPLRPEQQKGTKEGRVSAHPQDTKTKQTPPATQRAQEYDPSKRGKVAHKINLSPCKQVSVVLSKGSSSSVGQEDWPSSQQGASSQGQPAAATPANPNLANVTLMLQPIRPLYVDTQANHPLLLPPLCFRKIFSILKSFNFDPNKRYYLDLALLDGSVNLIMRPATIFVYEDSTQVNPEDFPSLTGSQHSNQISLTSHMDLDTANPMLPSFSSNTYELNILTPLRISWTKQTWPTINPPKPTEPSRLGLIRMPLPGLIRNRACQPG